MGRLPQTVKELKLNPLFSLPGATAEYSLHQIVHPMGAIDPAEKRDAALRHRFNRKSPAVDREIDQGAGLNIDAVFLYQKNFGGERPPPVSRACSKAARRTGSASMS